MVWLCVALSPFNPQYSRGEDLRRSAPQALNPGLKLRQEAQLLTPLALFFLIRERKSAAAVMYERTSLGPK